MIHTLRLLNLLQMPLSKNGMSHKSEMLVFLISIKSKLKETSSKVMLKVRETSPSMVTVRNLHNCMHFPKLPKHFGS